MERLKLIIEFIKDIIEYPLFKLGDSAITLSLLFFLVISITLLVYLSGRIKNLLQNRLLSQKNLDIGVRQAFSTIVKYVIVVIGLIIIIQTAGIDLSFLAILIGAFGVGVGFGLQAITNNFVSGIVILFERPIKVGDRIEVTNLSGKTVNGDVIDISSRATKILTNDNIAIIVPNSDLITSTVINWSYNDRRVRFNYQIPIHYKENPETVKKLLLEVAKENEGVLKHPPPDILFSNFEDNRLIFILRVWTTKYIQKPGVLKSQLYYAAFKKLRDNNIEIPFPQRDLHLRSGFEDLMKNYDSANEPLTGKK